MDNDNISSDNNDDSISNDDETNEMIKNRLKKKSIIYFFPHYSLALVYCQNGIIGLSIQTQEH